MGDWKVLWRKLLPRFNCPGDNALVSVLQMPGLRISADQDDRSEIIEVTKQLDPPCRGAFLSRRQVASMPVIAGKTKPHGKNREYIWIVEFVI